MLLKGKIELKLKFSIVIFNRVLKTYKIMIDENCEKIFANFINNTHFCTEFFRKTPEFDEFYVKDQSNIFYYYKIGDLIFFILYDHDTSFDDVNTVKITLKTLKENFDTNENYN